MRLIFYLIIFNQLFNLFDVLAEKIKKEPSESQIKWEKVIDQKSNNIKKLFGNPTMVMKYISKI